MIAVVFADRAGSELAPLTERTCAALLPVAGKPVLEHTVEALAQAGIRRARVVVSPHADLVEGFLGDGARWGLRLDYALSRGDEHPAAVLRRLRKGLAGEDILLLRGDVLRGAALGGFVERAQSTNADSVCATVGGVPAGLRFVRAGAADQLGTDPGAPDAWETAGVPVELEGATLSRLESLAAYHRANLEAAAGLHPGLLLPGRELAPRVRVGRRSSVPARSLEGEAVVVGERCAVGPDVELGGRVVLGDDVVVDRGARVQSAVVLPHTYIGEMLEVRDAIVDGERVIHVGSGVETRADDPLLFAATAPAGRSALGDVAHRGLGLMLLLLSLPLWPLALLASLRAAPRAPFRRVRLLGAKGEFEAFEAATPIPVLRGLTRLPAVAGGHLRLVGVEPLTPEAAEARREEWQRVRDAAPVGLIGPSLLAPVAAAPEEERRVVEAYYARTRSWREDLGWLRRGARELFSARAWRVAVAVGDRAGGNADLGGVAAV